jgi:polysaccharide biosynthesis/export protein
MKSVFDSAAVVLISRVVLPVVVLLGHPLYLLGQQATTATLAAHRMPEDSRAPLIPPSSARLVIGPGDLLTISVFNVPELQQTVRVSDGGDANVSLIGNMHLADMTVADAQALIETQYRDRNFLIAPHVNILVTEYATEGVSVLGEVTKPGVYPLLGPHTLLDIISAAGGLTQLAGSTVSVRRRNGEQQVVQLDANDPQKALAQDVELRPADMVVVARAAVVYVVGDVGKPGGFAMQNNGRLTLLQAIALAQGVNKTASLSHSKVIHKDPSGAYTTEDIHLAPVLHGKEPDRQLSAEDIVFIPNSKLKSAAVGGWTTAVQAASAAAIYH